MHAVSCAVRMSGAPCGSVDGCIVVVTWAASYETEGFGGRSLERHRAWLAGLPCPVLEITGTPTVEDSVARVFAALS